MELLLGPGGQNGIDDNDRPVFRTISIPWNVRRANEHENVYFALRIRFDANRIISPGGNTATFDFDAFNNDSATTIAQQHDQQVGTTPTAFTEVFLIPSDSEYIKIGITNEDNGNDGRLLIDNFEWKIVQGINAAGYTEDGRPVGTETLDLQALADDVYALVNSAANTTVDASGFDGNLATTDTNMQLVAQKFDDLDLQANQYIFGQTLNHGTGQSLSHDFTVVGTGGVNSNIITVPEIFRNISQDLIIRVFSHAETEPSTFRGRIRIIEHNTTTAITDTDPYSISGASASQAQGKDLVFQQRISAANIPEQMRVRFEGTSLNSATATFNNGSIQLNVPTGAESAMSQGQASDWVETIIWTAGLTTTARLVNNSVQTLLAGHTFGQYDYLQFNFDNGSNDGMLFPMTVLASQFRASANYGTFTFSDQYGYNVQPHGSGDNQFRFIWNGGGTKGP